MPEFCGRLLRMARSLTATRDGSVPTVLGLTLSRGCVDAIGFVSTSGRAGSFLGF